MKRGIYILLAAIMLSTLLVGVAGAQEGVVWRGDSQGHVRQLVRLHVDQRILRQAHLPPGSVVDEAQRDGDRPGVGPAADAEGH